jgi:hypothetical protein
MDVDQAKEKQLKNIEPRSGKSRAALVVLDIALGVTA